MTSDDIEIRLFGPLRVRRSDGTAVDPSEWSTGKTADLFRILAVNHGKAVAVDTILDALWPQVDRARGSASLRTAICQIRRVVRQDCIARRYDGLTLSATATDTVSFAELAANCRKFFAQESWLNVVTIAREAEGLYVGDLGAHDPSIAILDEHRSALREQRLRVLLDAADAAVQLRQYADGIDFAGRAIGIDAFSERAYRALMKSHAGAGETHRALRAFEQCRTALAQELSVDPAPQTHALHVQIVQQSPAVAARQSSNSGAISQRVTLLELIGDVATTAGHTADADDAYRAARSVALRHGLAVDDRLSPGSRANRSRGKVAARPLAIRDLVRELERDLHLVPARAGVPAPAGVPAAGVPARAVPSHSLRSTSGVGTPKSATKYGHPTPTDAVETAVETIAVAR